MKMIEQQAVDRLGHADELEPKSMRRYSDSAIVSAVPTSGPEQRVHAAQHDREHDLQRHADARERVRVDVGDVLRVAATPPSAVSAADSTVMPILKRVTWMPTEAAAVSSSPMASMRRARHAAVHAAPHPEAGQPEPPVPT